IESAASTPSPQIPGPDEPAALVDKSQYISRRARTGRPHAAARAAVMPVSVVHTAIGTEGDPKK
ncbi:MAG: hypothetical protein ACKO38_05885, partial [Planctomycetota bacterium]